MLTSPNGQGVIMIGGYNSNKPGVSYSFIELDAKTMKWTILNTKLQYARKGHVAFYISDNFIRQNSLPISSTIVPEVASTTSFLHSKRLHCLKENISKYVSIFKK